MLSLTPTNAEVSFIDRPDEESIFVSLDRVRLCYPEMSNKTWLGRHGKCTKKNVVKKKSQPALTNVASRQVGPVTWAMSRYRAQASKD